MCRKASSATRRVAEPVSRSRNGSCASGAKAGPPGLGVVGAGTGGTSATIGRYIRYRGLHTRLCVAEPAGGAFAQGWRNGDRDARAQRPTVIEGIGRSRVEPGFLFEIIDDVVEVPDAASIAAAWQLERLFGRRYGGSSGTNLVACLQLAARMHARRQRGSIVSLLCDRGERYDATLFDPAWLDQRQIDLAPWREALQATISDGRWREAAARQPRGAAHHSAAVGSGSSNRVA